MIKPEKPDQPNQPWRGEEQEEFKNQDLTPTIHTKKHIYLIKAI